MLSTILSSVTIVLVPMFGTIGTYRCGDMVGMYMNNTIYLCQGVQGNTEFYKYHEVGHHFWYKIMTQKQRDNYTKLYERDLKKGKFYRDYGKAPVGAGAVPYRINGTTPAAQTTAATTGLLDRGAVVTATGDANGAIGDLVGVHYSAEAEFIT